MKLLGSGRQKFHDSMKLLGSSAHPRAMVPTMFFVKVPFSPNSAHWGEKEPSFSTARGAEQLGQVKMRMLGGTNCQKACTSNQKLKIKDYKFWFFDFEGSKINIP